MLTRCQMLNIAVSVLTSRLPAQPLGVAAAITTTSRFERLIREMPAAELQYRSTSDLAKHCGCSERHFRRLFKKHFGRPPTIKRTEQRLLKARDILIDTDLKIVDVALESGFQHVGHFTALFKQRYGVTPAKWRARRRTKASSTAMHLNCA